MDLVSEDTRLNIGPAYLKPGFAFGGSCLPKDLRALIHRARSFDLDLPMLAGLLPSNDQHLQRGHELGARDRARRVALLGLSFKPGTDDLRESPLVELAETLLGKGVELSIYDPVVSIEGLIGTNLAFAEERLPHLCRVLVPTAEAALIDADAAIVGTRADGLLDRAPRRGPPLGARPRRHLARARAHPRLPRPRLVSQARPARSGPPPASSLGGRVTIVVQNLPVPFDRRVWLECQALVAAGYDVSVICPTGPGGESRYEELDGVRIHRYPPPRAARRGRSATCGSSRYCWARTAALARKILRTDGMDVLQACNPPDTYWALARAAAPRGVRFVFDQHDLCPEDVRVAVRASRSAACSHRGLLLAGAGHLRDRRPRHRRPTTSYRRGGADPRAPGARAT